MISVPTREVAAVISCLAQATDPTIVASLDRRRRQLLEAIAQMVRADAWIWIASAAHGTGASRTCIYTLDGGWHDDHERSIVLDELGQPTFEDFMRVEGAPEFSDVSNAQAFDVAQPRGGDGDGLRVTGFDQIIAAACPAPNAADCVVFLLRRDGKPPFSEDEQALAKVIVQNIPWLHTRQTDADHVSAALSPREREVVQLLLQGHGRKEVAAALNLSAHTVASYSKAIYKKLGVSSRAELLARYIRPENQGEKLDTPRA